MDDVALGASVRVVMICGLLAIAGSSKAEPAEIRKGPPPAWAAPAELLPVPETANGPAFVRLQDGEVRLSDMGQAQFIRYRVKIWQPSALQLGNIVLAWRPPTDSPIVHEIKIFRDGSEIDALKDAKFEVLRREDQLEAASLDGTLTAVYHVPDLRVGDEIEVALTKFDDLPTLRPHESGILFINAAPPPGRYHMRVSWDPGRTLETRASPDIRALITRTASALDVRVDNPGVVTPPSDAPPRFAWQRIVQYSDYPDWSTLSRQVYALFEASTKLDSQSPIKREAARIAAANATEAARARAALRLVQQDVRYVFVGLNGGNLVPASADETWRRRYGDCKAKTALLLALLGELKIKAEPVLVNAGGADDGLDQRLPLVDVFNHVLVRAAVDGAPLWLDGTLPPVAQPTPSPILPLSWVLPLSASGSQLERIPWKPAAVPDEISLFEIDAREGFDKPAKITTTQIVRGLKGLQQEVGFSTVSAEQLRELVRQQGVGATFQAIDDVSWRYDERAAASVLTIKGSGKVDWDDDGGGRRSLALPGGGFNPPERRARAGGVSPEAPFYTKPEYTCYVTTVRVPVQSLKGAWTSTPSFDQYYFGRRFHREFELRDGEIRMIRGSRVERPEITVADAKADNDRLSAFDNSMGNISYTPQPGKSAVGKGERVPSTSDFDWTVADPPCLGPGAKGQ